jgi:hypothetical protein
MRQFMEDERRFRKIEENANAPFLNWKEDGEERQRTSIIIAKTRSASKKLHEF